MSAPRAGKLEDAIGLGVEWVVDASGCERASLRDRARLESFIAELMATLRLTPAAPPTLHVFPGPEAGITAMVLLTESHLAIHTFPEHGALTLNLYCCKPRPSFDWALALRERFGAARVDVRELVRQAVQGSA